MQPLVSILIPARNAEEWIAETLHSAMAQTWPRKEIIVVDDGSTDRTLAVAEVFASQGVRVVTQENQGAAAARNVALMLSEGEYIQWLDADDLLAPDKIARQMEALGERPRKKTLLSCAWGRFQYRYRRARFKPTALWCDLTPLEWMLRRMEQNIYMQTATWLVPRELAEAAGPWDTRLMINDDGEYFFRVLLHSDAVRFVPEAKVYYRQSGFASVSYIGRSKEKMEAQLLSLRLQIDHVRSLEDTVRVRAACLAFLKTWLVYFFPERPDLVKQMEEIAKDLEGRLELPRLPWKYSWIEPLFGWRLAKEVQLFLPNVKWAAIRFLDKVLFRIENRKFAGNW
jgi:glycosyltransferase involved in cell wall biosynthesis